LSFHSLTISAVILGVIIHADSLDTHDGAVVASIIRRILSDWKKLFGDSSSNANNRNVYNEFNTPFVSLTGRCYEQNNGTECGPATFVNSETMITKRHHVEVNADNIANGFDEVFFRTDKSDRDVRQFRFDLHQDVIKNSIEICNPKNDPNKCCTRCRMITEERKQAVLKTPPTTNFEVHSQYVLIIFSHADYYNNDLNLF